MSLVEFNEWYGEKGEKLHIYRDEKWIAKHGFEAGQQSQQGEVDKLQTEIGELRSLFESVVSDDMKTIQRLESVIDENNAEIKELQGRIDEVLKACNNLRTDSIREHCAEYDKGWKDCATTIYHQLKRVK